MSGIVTTKTEKQIDAFLARKRNKYPDLFISSVDDVINDLDETMPKKNKLHGVFRPSVAI